MKLTCIIYRSLVLDYNDIRKNDMFMVLLKLPMTLKVFSEYYFKYSYELKVLILLIRRIHLEILKEYFNDCSVYCDCEVTCFLMFGIWFVYLVCLTCPSGSTSNSQFGNRCFLCV